MEDRITMKCYYFEQREIKHQGFWTTAVQVDQVVCNIVQLSILEHNIR